MKRLLSALAVVLASPASAQTDISADIGARGLAAVQADLAARADLDDRERFALAGVMFLGGVESALQTRYRHSISTSLTMIPVLRLPVPANPRPEPFSPGAISDLFRELAADMSEATAILEAIPEDSDFGFELRLSDLWFDIDANGTRGRGESLFEVVGPLLFTRTGFNAAAMRQVVIRFDVADSRWLAAYASLLDGFSLAILAYDPSKAIAEVMEANATFARMNEGLVMLHAFDMNFGGFVDSAAVVYRALDQQPDAALAAGAHQRLLDMIRHNRAFWSLLAAETDNLAEWIPNDNQTSALGLTVPPGTGEVWQEVLADAEKLLNGELLLPYWRLADGAGLNLRKMFLDPRPLDLVEAVQGMGFVPFAERGPRISAENWRQFDQLMQGRGLLFAALLN